MARPTFNLKALVSVAALTALLVPAAFADEDRLDTLLDELRNADPGAATRIERELELEWSKSGSAAMDLLLKRARDALETGDLTAAVEHFTALTDHAPDFAEGWHGRATVFYRQDRYGQALDDLERALRLNPHHYGALHGLGVILEQLDEPDLAHRAYSQVLAIHPNHAEVTEALKRLEPKVRGKAL